MKKICLLGSTGSIGKQTIEIINENPKDFSLVGVSCGQNINELRNILKNYPSITSCCVKKEKDSYYATGSINDMAQILTFLKEKCY